MNSRLAKRLGVPVSEIGLGCWQLGSADWGQVSDDAAFEILQASVDRGVTFIDTADVYGSGRSESLIGRFL
jgi:aryl-alcohol dehydrogenase-like predicted oxidoreductase